MTKLCEEMSCLRHGAVEILEEDGYVAISCWEHFLDPACGNQLRTWFRA